MTDRQLHELVNHITTRLRQNSAYTSFHDPEHKDNGHAIIDEGEFRFGAYLREFMGETSDPNNSEDKRYSNNLGTVGISDSALALLGAGSIDHAISILEELQVGSRVAVGKTPFYLRLDVNELNRLKIDRFRDC